jgi:protein O-mannosyl-transferase
MATPYRRRPRAAPRPAAPLEGWLAGGAIVLLAVLAYLPALHAGFVWDDHELISANSELRGPLWRIWFAPAAADYWPLTWTALWLELRLFGLEAAPFHLVNVLLHAATSVLLWRVVRALRIPGAWLAGLLFAVHPVTVESVAFVSELENVLSAVPALAATLRWIRFVEEGRGRDLLLAALLFATALLAKTSLVMLPLVLLAIAAFRRGRLERRDLAAAAPLFALSAAAGLTTIWFQHRLAMNGEETGRGLAERVGGAGWALWSYLETALLPVRVGVLHGPWPVGPDSALYYVPCAAALLAAGLLWWLRRSLRPLGLALAVQAVMLLPVLGLVDLAFLRVAPVSNHLHYVPLMGPVVLLAWGLDRVLRPLPVAGAVTLGLPVLAALVLFTAWRAQAFQDDEALWARAVLDAPDSPHAWAQLANVREQQGRPAAAAEAFEALAVRARDDVWRRTGRMYAHYFRGRLEQAVAEARGLLAATPRLLPRRRAAAVLQAEGQAGEALAVLQDLVARAPRSSEFSLAYAQALFQGGAPDQAATVLATWCRAWPGNPIMERAYAAILVQLGDLQGARARAALALDVRQDDPGVTALLRELAPGTAGAR